MDKYELTIVLPAGTTAAKIKTIKADLESLIKVSRGSVVKEDNWGEKNLAYEVEGNQTGVFLHYLLELTKDQVKNLDQKVVLNTDIIRHLVIKSDNVEEVKEPKKKTKKAKTTKANK